MRLSFFAALGAISVLLVPSGLAQVKQGGHGFAGAKLTAHPTTSWPTNGGNLFNQRYSPLKAINRTNVAQLKGVWRARLRGSGLFGAESPFGTNGNQHRLGITSLVLHLPQRLAGFVFPKK